MVSDRSESHEQDGERLLRAKRIEQRPAILPWRSSLSDANGQSWRPSLFSAASCRRANKRRDTRPLKTARARPARTSTADIQPFDQFLVTRLIAPLDVVEELAALRHHLEQAAA